MLSKTIYKILEISIDEFSDELENIKNICHNYDVKEIEDVESRVAIFYFYESKDWIGAKRQIQHTVGEIIFKQSSKCVSIEKKMRTPVDPTPPPWFEAFHKEFLKFQKEMYKFQEDVYARLDKLETTQPIWFTKWVETDFNPLKYRIDNIVKLNNLKE